VFEGLVWSLGLERLGPRPRLVFTGSNTAKDWTELRETSSEWSFAVTGPVSTS